MSKKQINYLTLKEIIGILLLMAGFILTLLLIKTQAIPYFQAEKIANQICSQKGYESNGVNSEYCFYSCDAGATNIIYNYSNSPDCDDNPSRTLFYMKIEQIKQQ